MRCASFSVCRDTSLGAAFSFDSLSNCNPFDHFETVALTRFLEAQDVLLVACRDS